LEPLPSTTSPPVSNLPPEDIPVEEHDLTHVDAWEDGDGITPTVNKKGKGKGKATDDDASSSSSDSAESQEVSTYPPQQEDEMEERRIQENLRKWEAAERQKRRLTREASISLAATQHPSVVGDVSKRASALWNRGMPLRTKPRGTGSGSGHQVLTGEDLDGDGEAEHVPIALSHIDASPSQSPLPSATPTQAQFNMDMDERPETPIENPFEDPGVLTRVSSHSTSSDSSENHSAIMTSAPSTPATGLIKSKKRLEEDQEGHPHRPILQASSSFTSPPSRSKAPPPEPLLLPPPKTPPLRINTPNAHISPPPRQEQTHPDDESSEPEPKEVRWWTDWLCGCSEGLERGGEHQAGRTNPFE